MNRLPNAETLDIRAYRLAGNGAFPNNARLPALVYRSALAADPSAASELFRRNGWGNDWVNGVFSYHHYHSNSHEALAVLDGAAELELGGPGCVRLSVSAADVLVLPAGTSHSKVSASPPFSVAGAYPGGSDYNTRTEADDTALAEIRREILAVPLPEQDPLFGPDGPLLQRWKDGAE